MTSSPRLGTNTSKSKEDSMTHLVPLDAEGSFAIVSALGDSYRQQEAEETAREEKIRNALTKQNALEHDFTGGCEDVDCQMCDAYSMGWTAGQSEIVIRDDDRFYTLRTPIRVREQLSANGERHYVVELTPQEEATQGGWI